MPDEPPGPPGESLEPPAPPPDPALPAPAGATLACWEAVVDDLRDGSPQLAACLEHAAIVRLDRDEVSLAWDNGSVFSDQVTAPASRAALDRALARHLQSSPKLSLQFELAQARGAVTLARRHAEARARERHEAVERVKQLPEVTRAVEILGGRIKEIRIGDE